MSPTIADSTRPSTSLTNVNVTSAYSAQTNVHGVQRQRLSDAREGLQSTCCNSAQSAPRGERCETLQERDKAVTDSETQAAIEHIKNNLFLDFDYSG